jgi:hypothetical protein
MCTADPLQPAVVAADDIASRPPGHLTVGIGASAGSLLAGRRYYDRTTLYVNIRGKKSYTISYLSLAQCYPFVLRTGYSDWSQQKQLPGQKRLKRPYSQRELKKHLLQTLANHVALSGDTGASSIS